MAAPLQVDGEEPVVFREVEAAHRQRLVHMHEQLFPVNYSDSFYDKAVQKTGLRGGELFTSIAFQCRGGGGGGEGEGGGEEVMVGFVMGQFLPIEKCEERMDLFDGLGEPERVYYILTLGVEKGMRRSGLGTELLRQCVEDASRDVHCGAVYLHVISYNTPALRFYTKNGFTTVAQCPGFYKIHNKKYSSELCSLYLNDYRPPLLTRVQSFISHHGSSMARWFRSMLQIETAEKKEDDEKRQELYMDELVLPTEENGLTCPTDKTQLPDVEFSTVNLVGDAPPPGFSLGDNIVDGDDQDEDLNDSLNAV